MVGLGKHDPLCPWGDHRLQLQVRIALHFFGQGAVEPVGHVGFLIFEHCQASGCLGDALHHQTFDVWRLAPVVRIGFQHQLDARLVAHEAIGPQADGLFLELLAADFLRIVLRHNPARPGGWCGVEGQKIRPGFVERITDVVWIHNLNSLDLVFQIGCPCPLVALEAVFDILGGEGVTVMKLHPLPQLKVVRQAIRTLAPLRGKAGGHGVVWHGFY